MLMSVAVTLVANNYYNLTCSILLVIKFSCFKRNLTKPGFGTHFEGSNSMPGTQADEWV